MAMLRLMLLRHAKADHPAGVTDHERPLAGRGRAEAAAMGRYMAAAGLLPDLAIVSTARRSQETWDLARSAFAADVDRRNEARIYEASVEGILEVMREVGPDVRSLLLIGHNPGFQALALWLVGKAGAADPVPLRQNYPPAGIVVIDVRVPDWREISSGSGRLERFVTPASLGVTPRAG